MSSRSYILNRRELFSWVQYGLTGAALAALVARDSPLNAATTPGEAKGKLPHHPPRAKRVIHLCCCGGVSQVDTFDYKPKLAEFHGKPLGASERPDVFFGQVGLLRKNDWEFKQRGKSGLWISELLPHLAGVADELTVIRSMTADSSSHTPATFQELSGFRLNGFPTMGAWISYGLGCATDELPAFVVLPDPRGLPAGGTVNWTNGFLSARHQGVAFQSKGPPILDLVPARPIPPDTDLATRELLDQLNRQHQQTSGAGDALASRMRSYELAAKMQLAVPGVTDLSGETAAAQAAYGLDRKETAEFGRNCLLARRLIEKGVRFVQLFAGGAFGSPRINWDGHENVKDNHSQEALRFDQPAAALIRDLAQRGLLQDTLVLCTSEFGRTPFTQSAANTVGAGRDHNQNGFTVWLAGGGLKPGIAYGATDDVGYKAVENPVTWPDFHATVLHLLGVDHERLTFYHNGIERRLTNVHGQVQTGILS